MYYDLQKLRIASGQRLLAQFLVKLGLPPELPALKEDATKEEKEERKLYNQDRADIINAFLEKHGIAPIEIDEEEGINVKKKGGKKRPSDFFAIIIREYKGITDWIVAEKGRILKEKLIKELKDDTKNKVDSTKLIDELSSATSRLTNEAITTVSPHGVISDESEYYMLKSYDLLMESEKEERKPIELAVQEHPLWQKFLIKVRGCGELLASVIISEFDIHDSPVKDQQTGKPIEVTADFVCTGDFHYVQEVEVDGIKKHILMKKKTISSFMAYAGQDVTDVPTKDKDGNILYDEDGVMLTHREGRCKKKDHQIKVKYINRKGELQERNSITYNAFLKTKLYLLGESFMKAIDYEVDEDGVYIRDEKGKKIKKGPNYYGSIYHNYRNRLDQMPIHDSKSNGHKKNMAMRYMIKAFIKDLFVAWCIIEGKEVPTPYEVAKLGMEPHSTTCPYLLPLLQKEA